MQRATLDSLRDGEGFDAEFWRERPSAAAARLVSAIAVLTAFALAGLFWKEVPVVAQSLPGAHVVSATSTVAVPFNGPATAFGDAAIVKEVTVKVNDRVVVGQVLAVLDDARARQLCEQQRLTLVGLDDEVAGLSARTPLVAAEANSNISKTEAELAIAMAERDAALRSHPAALEELAVKLRLAEDDLKSARSVGRSAMSGQKIVELQGQVETARAQLHALRERALPNRTAPAEHDVKQARLRGEQQQRQHAEAVAAKRLASDMARAALARAEADAALGTVRSPVTGTVLSVALAQAQTAKPGGVVAEVAPEGRQVFELELPSEQMAGVVPGLPAWVKIDAYPYAQYGKIAGKVESVAPVGTQRTEGGHTRAVFRVRVAFTAALPGKLVLGYEGQAQIITGRTNLFQYLVLDKVYSTILMW